ncbi:hypothetical protein MTR67_022932 [Solanum verrucosum]|uniref:Uncharacterized protein n=1 Tax=Solanum verrucosum TaxID=315347 RepID=A0AAF0QSL9_SOLVR|nr:hypothetical protein MTR67_022932 [Solanum verrucosum]
MSLQNPYLIEALKIQVQILGAPQDRDAIHATLHYQLAWRIQNHAMDLSFPGGQDSLFLNINAINGTTQCTQIPREIPRRELVQVLPDTCVTKHEKLRVHPQHLFFEEPDLTMPKNHILSHFPHKRPNQIVFPIHMHQSHIDIPEDKDPYIVSWFLSCFKCEHDCIRAIQSEWMRCTMVHLPLHRAYSMGHRL